MGVSGSPLDNNSLQAIMDEKYGGAGVSPLLVALLAIIGLVCIVMMKSIIGGRRAKRRALLPLPSADDVRRKRLRAFGAAGTTDNNNKVIPDLVWKQL